MSTLYFLCVSNCNSGGGGGRGGLLIVCPYGPLIMYYNDPQNPIPMAFLVRGFLPYRDKLVQLGRLPQSMRILAKAMSATSDCRRHVSQDRIQSDSAEPTIGAGIVTPSIPLWSLYYYTIVAPKTLFKFRAPILDVLKQRVAPLSAPARRGGCCACAESTSRHGVALELLSLS